MYRLPCRNNQFRKVCQFWLLQGRWPITHQQDLQLRFHLSRFQVFYDTQKAKGNCSFSSICWILGGTRKKSQDQYRPCFSWFILCGCGSRVIMILTGQTFEFERGYPWFGLATGRLSACWCTKLGFHGKVVNSLTSCTTSWHRCLSTVSLERNDQAQEHESEWEKISLTYIEWQDHKLEWRTSSRKTKSTSQSEQKQPFSGLKYSHQFPIEYILAIKYLVQKCPNLHELHTKETSLLSNKPNLIWPRSRSGHRYLPFRTPSPSPELWPSQPCLLHIQHWRDPLRPKILVSRKDSYKTRKILAGFYVKKKSAMRESEMQC